MPAPSTAPVSAPVAAPTAASTAPACPRALALDAKAVAEEAACLLAAYVRIDTTNPPGGEIATARFLRDVLARDGIDSQIIESAPGRANLIARLRGSGKARAVVLMHHMDVVPALASEWSVPPFAAVVRDGYLWGRGALDNKGGGVITLMTMLLAKRLATPLDRDLVLLACADEEAGGGQGARFLTEHRPDLFADVDFVLTEGGAIVQLGEGHTVYSVELAQKAPLWLRVTAHGHSGHGSTPIPDSAVMVLLRGLSRLTDHRFAVVVVPAVQALYAAKAEAAPAEMRAGYRDLQKALKKPAFRAQFLKDPHDAALVQNTLSITMLQASDKENVISAEASAVLDMRLLPGQDAAEVTREVAAALGEPSLELTPILSWKAFASPANTPLFAAIEALAHARDPGAPVAANVIGAFTDCNAFRAHDITCYGFLPLRLQPSEFERVHGKDERMSVEDLGRATIDLHTLLLGLAPKAAP